MLNGRRRLIRWRDERGQVLILGAAVIIVMLFLGTVVVDVGNWFIHRRHLQTQVDAAALAAAGSFSGCFLTQATANTKIANTALLYAGDTNPGRQPTGALSPPLNVQVAPDTNVHVVLNSDDYWPTATTDGWTATNPGGWATSDAQKPCTVKYVDVKATDDDVPGLLKLIPFLPDIHATARVEIRKAQGFTGLLPWAVPSGDPTFVVAIFYNETNGNVLGAQQLVKGSYVPLNGTSLRDWAADVSVNVQAQTGVVILTSQAALTDPPNLLLPTLGQMCAQVDAQCFGGNTPSDGLALVRAIENGAPASAANPKLTDVKFGAGSCSTDTSAGYYVLTGDCNPNVTAKIDFGLPPAPDNNPTVAPTFARVTLNGPGCPCTMAWRQSDDTWVLDTGAPLLAQLSGQNAYSVTWQTGGAGPGAGQVALVTPAGPAGVAPRAVPIAPATPAPPTRGLAAAAGTTGTVNVKVVTVGSPPLPLPPFPITVSVTGGTATPSSFNGTAAGQDVVITKNDPYVITQSPVPSYITTYSPNCTNPAGVPDGGLLNCVITNTWQSGTLTVNKVCVPVADPGKFNLRVDGSTVTANATCGNGTGPQQYSIGSHTVTETAGTGTILGDYTSVISGACAANGTVTLAVGDNKVCTITNTFVGGGVGPVESGTFDLVARPYATNLASGPVDYLLLTDGLANRTYFFTSTGTRTIHVEVGLEPSIKAATGPSDPPLTLRIGSGSRTQLLDCDHANRNADEEIATGCLTGYSLNPPPGDCSAYGGGGSSLPPPLPPPQTFPNCVAVANGATVGQVRDGLDTRFGKTPPQCATHPNNWALYQSGGTFPPLTDSRYVVLILTDFDTFGGGGAGKVPVRRFAGFYVTGWSSASNQCANAANNEPPPPGTQASSNKAEVWGHFVNYVAPSNDNDPGPDLCAFDSTDICIAVLTR